MQYWNRNLISSTKRPPAQSGTTGIYDLRSHYIYKNDDIWPLDPYLVDLKVHVDANNSNSNPGSGTTWSDLTSNNIDFTLNNGAAFGTSSGVSYVEFDGTNDYAVTGTDNALSLGTSDFTVSVWFYFDSLKNVADIFDFRTVSNNGFAGFLKQYGSAMRFRIWMGPNNSAVFTSTDLTTSAWTNVVVRRSGSTNKVYINGAANGSTYTNSSNFSGNKVHLGANYSFSSGGFYDGRVGRFALHHRALSDAEVLADFNANKGAYGL